MTLMRWEPLMNDGLWMDRLFDNLLPARRRPDEEEPAAIWWPRTDIVEEKGGYLIEVDLPGLRKEDIKVSIQDNHLEVTGQRNLERKEEQEGYKRLERAYGLFRRSFHLPKGTDPSKIESAYENGVLAVRVPKSEAATARQIEVKVR